MKATNADRDNSEHQDLADSVRSLVARVAPSEVLHAALEKPGGAEPAAVLAGRGRTRPHGLHSAEWVGGQGFDILVLAIVLAEFGYGAVPGPVVPSAIASALIRAHDAGAEVLPSWLPARRSPPTPGFRADRDPPLPRRRDPLSRGEVRAVPAAAQASCWCCRWRSTAARRGMGGAARRAAGDRAGQKRGPAAPHRACAANAVEVGDDAVLATLA